MTETYLGKRSTLVTPREVLYFTPEDAGQNTLKFTFSPLTKGFGLSVGHTLRRTLLAHSPAISPIALKLNGVTHEFAPVPGIAEDMLAIKAALRTMPISATESFDDTLHLKFSLPAKRTEVTAKDLPKVHGLNFTQPNHKLFTTTGTNPIEMEIWFACGYPSDDPVVVAKKLEMLNPDVQTIKVESFFHSVTQVGINITTTKKGHKTFDVLEMTVSTDSSITPLDAIQHAIQVFFADLGQSLLDLNFVYKEDSSDIFEAPDIDLQQSISGLALNPAIIECLEGAGIKTIGELVEMPSTLVEGTPTLTPPIIDRINTALGLLHKNLKLKNIEQPDLE